MLSESPLLTVYERPDEVAGALVDSPDVTSEKSAGLPRVAEPELASEKSGLAPVYFSSPGSLPKTDPALSKIPIFTSRKGAAAEALGTSWNGKMGTDF